jgi:hypothetical protein
VQNLPPDRNPTVVESMSNQETKEIGGRLAQGEAKSLFDLADSGGVNESERILTRLCKHSFLRLWSQTNVFTDEGFKGGKGATKELTDALVIFDRDVIIFSDKHVRFQHERDLAVAWPRWYRRAVLESCKQLHGAKSWLTRFPDRAFLDARCTRKLPIAVPTGSDVRFHLVAVTRGSKVASIKHVGEGSLGSFVISSALEGDDHLANPFVIGVPEPSKAFVHVFDEVSIELVMQELDTAADFLDYLKAREKLLGRRGCQVFAPGEHELLAAYLRTMDPTGTRHVFLNQGPGEDLPDLVMYDGSHYAGLQDDGGYQRKKLADRISYNWDSLIDRFIDYGDPGICAEFSDQSLADTEEGLRLLAAESRFRRRQLAHSLKGALDRVEPGMRLCRILGSQIDGETTFVFLVMPWRDENDYDEYRKYRLAVLNAYVQTARLRVPTGKTFVGIAIDNPHKAYQGGSEDLLVFRKEEFTDKELVDLEKMRQELDLWNFNRVEESRYIQDEFPLALHDFSMHREYGRPASDLVRSNSNSKRKAGKRRKKMQQTSKRANRKRRR